MQIKIGKTGTLVDVDEGKFNETVNAYVFRYGLTQILNDTHSALTKGVATADEIMEAVNEKLASMYAGTVRVAGGRESDPVRAEAIRIAIGMVKSALKAQGKKVADYKGSQLREAAEKLLAKRPEILETAKSNVANAQGLGAVEVEL